MISGQSLTLGPPARSLNGSAPRGEHPDGLPPVTPQSDNCQDCHPPAYPPAARLESRSPWRSCYIHQRPV